MPRKEKTRSLTIGYIKTSIDKQLIMNQKLEILEYCRTRGLNIDSWIEINTSTPERLANEKRIEEILSLGKGDILICTDVARLGKSTTEVLKLVHQILKGGVKVIFTSPDLVVDPNQSSENSRLILAVFATLSELEKDIISLRIKEGFSEKKKQGNLVGKAKGTIQSSIYDLKKEQITLLLSKGVSVFDISKIIGIGKPRSLLIYLNKRKLREPKK